VFNISNQPAGRWDISLYYAAKKIIVNSAPNLSFLETFNVGQKLYVQQQTAGWFPIASTVLTRTIRLLYL
jgi:hypothetical protein